MKQSEVVLTQSLFVSTQNYFASTQSYFVSTQNYFVSSQIYFVWLQNYFVLTQIHFFSKRIDVLFFYSFIFTALFGVMHQKSFLLGEKMKCQTIGDLNTVYLRF